VLPFPAVKEPPAIPPELVRRYLRRLVVVYAVINTGGKLEQIAVKDSPDALLNAPITATLSRWVFRPAQLNGAPAAVKVLIGIPLWPKRLFLAAATPRASARGYILFGPSASKRCGCVYPSPIL
jgi:hypothetical protein